MTVLHHPHMNDTTAELPAGADASDWIAAGWVSLDDEGETPAPELDDEHDTDTPDESEED